MVAAKNEKCAARVRIEDKKVLELFKEIQQLPAKARDYVLQVIDDLLTTAAFVKWPRAERVATNRAFPWSTVNVSGLLEKPKRIAFRARRISVKRPFNRGALACFQKLAHRHTRQVLVDKERGR